MSNLTLKIVNQVARLQIDNAARLNCLDSQMLDQLESHCSTLEQSKDVRVCLLGASDARAFCAGADIHEWSELSPRDFSEYWLRHGNRIFSRFAQLPMPTIALVDGAALGGGLELLCCCDIRLATENASFALPETGMGVVPAWSGTQRLARLIPETLLKQMLLSGKHLTAQQMAATDFVELVSDLQASADSLVDAIAARSPEANRIAKIMLHAAVGENQSVMIDALGGGLVAASDDKEVGVNAFKSKSKPSF